jgi:tetratricopeptide (TPR) repeat protein
LLASIICLVVGLALGYYWGKESADSTHQAQSATPFDNTSGFLQDEAALKSMLLSNPRDLNTLIRLGNLYYDHRQFREAIDYYGRALDIDPNNPDVRTDRGTSYWNIGQTDAAIGEFQKSLDVNPGHAHTLYNLGLVYLNGKSNQDEARKAWERLLVANPNYPERAKVEQQLAALTSAGSSSGSIKEPTSDIQNLMQRLKDQ